MNGHLRLEHPTAYKECVQNNEKNIIERVSKNNYVKGIRWRSWTRKYYSKVNAKFIKCLICDRFLKHSFGSSTGNINRHIRVRHPYVYFNENKSKTSTQDDDSSNEETDKATEHELIKDSKTVVPSERNSEIRDDDVVETREKLMLKNKRKISNISKHHNVKGKRWSWTRKYYFKVNDKFIKCQICDRLLRISCGNTGNINRHIRLKHPHVYLNENKSKSPTRDNDSSDEETGKATECESIKESNKLVPRNHNSEIQDDDVVESLLNKSVENKTDIDKTRESVTREKCMLMNTKELVCDYKDLKETEHAVKQIFYIKEIDKIVTKDNNAQDKEASESVIYETLDNMSDDNETEQAQLAEKVANRKRSWTRHYYYQINNNLIKCRICHMFLNMNIHRHIKCKHPDIYLKENPVPPSQELSVEEELRIKNLCENKAVGSSPHRSCFWNFFEMIERDRVYKCSFCQKSVAIGPKSVSNLKRHIVNAHRKQYEVILKYRDLETKNLVALAASGAEVPGLSSVEIAFLSVDDDDTGKFKCSRCDAVIECTEEDGDSVLIEHVQACQLKPLTTEPLQIESDEQIVY